MKKATIGILAHVDAGKTTLIEQLLVAAGKKAEAGRVDHGTAFLDTDVQERARGITISSKMCRIDVGDLSMILMDTPGHVDFMAESERVLPVLDAAILVIGAGERIPAHAQYLFRLLKDRSIPALVFFNKMDLPVPSAGQLSEMLRNTLGDGFISADNLFDSEGMHLSPASDTAEEIAVLDEELLERFLNTGILTEEDMLRLFRRGKLFPCCYGSALQGQGIDRLLNVLTVLLRADKEEDPTSHDKSDFEDVQKEASGEEPLGAYCYKVLYDEAGNRVTFLKILSGRLNVREAVGYLGKIAKGTEMSSAENGAVEKEYNEKVTQIRLYDGPSYQAVQCAEPGEIVGVTGLTATSAGCGIGIAPSVKPEESRPMLRFRLLLPEVIDARQFLPKLRMLEEEEDTLSVEWQEEQGEIDVLLYGEVQQEILTERIRDRFGINVSFDEGTVVYRETLSGPAYGVGHFEPLRHYAEVHFLMEPMPRGTGILLESRLSTDELGRNWQQTILNAVEQEALKGVLINAPLTDLKLTLVAGRAHAKHTEGGDFREAALRAIRQGLMEGKAEGKTILLEPYVRFTLTVPSDTAGRALYDMNQLASECSITKQSETLTIIEGRGAISKLRNYMTEVRTYSHGEGIFRMIYDGFDLSPEQETVVERFGYQPESDLTNPAGSVFVDHGAADYVSWCEVSERAHLEPRFRNFYPEADETDEADAEGKRQAGKKSPALFERLEAIGTEEIDQILLQASHANQTGEHAKERRNRWNSANHRGSGQSSSERSAAGFASRQKNKQRTPYLLIDGYNIVHAWEETRGIVGQNLDAARQILLDMLVEYRALISQEIIVVFDAYRVPRHHSEIQDYQNLHVVYTGKAETADQYIMRFAAEQEKNFDITVATSDGMVQLIIRCADAKLLSARELRSDVLEKKRKFRETYLSDQ